MSKIRELGDLFRENRLVTEDIIGNEYQLQIEYKEGGINDDVLVLRLAYTDDRIYLDDLRVRELRDFLNKFL